MARLAVVLASLALLGTGIVGVAALAPESLPPQLTAYMPAKQVQGMQTQLQTVADRLDRLAGDLEKVRQAQADQAAAIGSLSAAQQQAAERVPATQDDAAQQSALGELRQQLAELEKTVAGMRKTEGAALITGTAAPAKPPARRPARHSSPASAQTTQRATALPGSSAR
jgi:hypothetical protein